MRLLLPLLGTLLITVAGASQQAVLGSESAAPSDLAWNLSQPSPNSCPLGLHVSFAPSQSLLTIAPESTPKNAPLVQRIHVDLQNPKSVDVVSVDAHVQGIPNSSRMLLTENLAASQPVSPVPSAPFHTDRRVRAQSQISLEWALNNATGVEWVQLDRIAYADGSTWQRKQVNVCKVSPDLVMRVNQDR